MLIWRADAQPAMAMADPKRASRGRGGADAAAPRALPAPAAAQKQARPVFARPSSLSERSRPPAEGQVIEGYDVLADLDRVIAGDADDACRARLEAWHRAQIEQNRKEIRKEIREEIRKEIREEIRKEIREQIDYDIRVGIPRDMVRAYALPPVPEPP